MKEESKKFQDLILNEDEENLFSKYLEEYNDIYPKILLLNPLEFFQNILKGLELTLKERINGFSQESKAKIEEYLIEKIYPTDYKFASFVRKNIKNRNSTEISSHYFKGEILSHCDGDKSNDGYYVHSCGEKFQYFRFKTNNNLSNSVIYKGGVNSSIDKKNNDICLFCEKCDMIYRSNFIKFKCNSTGEDFYSKILDNNKDDFMPFATWKKYHCNAIMNDKMKCQNCNNELYFISNNKVFCKICNKELNPLDIKYKCLICKNNFSSEAKIFNSLEYKALKICIKDAIISKIKAKPKFFGCGCNNDIKKIKFIHRKYCRGELFLGELHGKKVVVCNKCDSIGNYENYIWTCPLCYKKFKDIEKEENLNKDINIEKNVNKETSLERKNSNNKMVRKGSIVPKTSIKSILFKNLRHINNKENINVNNINVINSKIDKEREENSVSKNNKSSVLKTIEKSSSGLSIHSRLFTEIDNKSIIKLIEKDDKSNFTNKKKRNMPLIASRILNFTGNKRDSKIINNIPKGNSNYQKVSKIESSRESIEIKNLNNIFQGSIEKSEEKINQNRKNRNISDVCGIHIRKKIHKAVSANDVRKKNFENCLYTDFIFNNQNVNKNNENKYKNSVSPCISKEKEENNDSLIKNKIKQKNFNLANKIKRYNSSLEKDGKSEIVRVIQNIKEYKCKRSAKKSIFNKEFISSENDNESLKVKKNLCKYNSKQELTKNIFEKEETRIKMLKDFNVSDYKIIKKIGHGSFGQIFMVKDSINRKYALKKIIGSSEKEIKSLKQEYQILYDIQSNFNEQLNKINVVNIYGLSTKQLDPTTYVMYVLMELSKTDWEKEILFRQRQNLFYGEEELFKILFNLVDTLAKLQKENISHRDIKPQNILVFEDKYNINYYKLADFGEAKELFSGNKPTEKQTLRGTELYMSPLLFYGLRSRKIKRYIKHNPFKSDVFSLGLCILFAATLCFESLYDIRELKSNVAIKIIIEKYLKKRYSFKIINLISDMLDINENTRNDFIDLKKKIENLYNN
jgi:hypothetical protein